MLNDQVKNISIVEERKDLQSRQQLEDRNTSKIELSQQQSVKQPEVIVKILLGDKEI